MKDYLVHYGVLGMKWGVRRYQNPDGTLTSAGKARYSTSGKIRGLSEQERKAYDEKAKTKDNLKLAARVALSIASGNPAILIDTVQAANASRKEVKYKAEREGSAVDKKTGLKLKNRDYTEKEDLSRVNPGFKNFSSNTKNNCMLCTTAYELRRRGYDVTANKTSIGYENNDVRSWFPNAKVIDGPTIVNANFAADAFGFKTKERKQYNQECVKTLVDQGDGARGNLMVVWNGTGSSGHSVSYEITNGKCILRDAQANYVYKKPEELFSMTKTMTYARLDNVDFDTRRIKEAVN